MRSRDARFVANHRQQCARGLWLLVPGQRLWLLTATVTQGAIIAA